METLNSNGSRHSKNNSKYDSGQYMNISKFKKTTQIKPSMIKNVYAHNIKEEMLNISNLIEEFPYIGMDTEFPGIVYSKENSQFRSFTNYHLTKVNVDALKLIQVGITLADKNGYYPEETCTWQFNLKFDINQDLHQSASIQLLTSSGIDFESHNKNGIDHIEFGEYLISSGLILNNEVCWITFHGIYDFAYLLKILKNLKLPENEKDFNEDLDLYFNNYYDLRHLILYTDYTKGSLQKLATECNIQRIGTQHQAGSDSVVTLMAFFRMNEIYGQVLLQYKNILFHYIEKDDVDFDTNKWSYPINNFSQRMMYMYSPYYGTMGVNNNGNIQNMQGMMNMGNMMNFNINMEEKK